MPAVNSKSPELKKAELQSQKPKDKASEVQDFSLNNRTFVNEVLQNPELFPQDIVDQAVDQALYEQ